jgi:hypothetical protein
MQTLCANLQLWIAQTQHINNMTTLAKSHTQATSQPHQYDNRVDGFNVPQEYLPLQTTHEDQNDNSYNSMFYGHSAYSAESEDHQSIADSESAYQQATYQESDANHTSNGTHAGSRHTEGIYNEAHEDTTNDNGESIYSDVDEQNAVYDEMDDSYGTGAGRDVDNTVYQTRQENAVYDEMGDSYDTGADRDVDNTIYQARQGIQWPIKRYFLISFC